MTERALLPQFIREALERDTLEPDIAQPNAALPAVVAVAPRTAAMAEPAVLRALLALEQELQGPSASTGAGPALLARLESTLSQPPHRYAPFFASLAELFDLPETDVVAQLSRLSNPGVWTFAGLPGIAKLPVTGGPRVAQAETLLVRFSPGVRFPEHHHVGLERVLVLEGSYQDSNGVLHQPGELRDWPSNTAHSFRVGSQPCIFASVVFGRRFSSWPLRALARVLGS